jgi:hypothetical protein
MSDDLVGWYNRLLVRVPEPIVHADRRTDAIANMTAVLILLAVTTAPGIKSISVRRASADDSACTVMSRSDPRTL